MAAAKKETATKPQDGELVALKSFRDKETKLFYEAGADASAIKGQRLEDLQKLGLVGNGEPDAPQGDQGEGGDTNPPA